MLRSRFLWRLYGAFALIILLTATVVGVLVSRQVRRDAGDARVAERLEHAHRAFVIGAGASAALALLLALWVTRRMTRPLAAITERAEALAAGEVGDTLPVEIGRAHV